MLLSSASLNASFGKTIDSPKQQLANGVEPKDIICKQGLVLAIIFGNVPVCLKPLTAQGLEKRLHKSIIFPELAQKTEESKTIPSEKSAKGATIQGESGGPEKIIETIPASGGSIVNFYITDNDLNTSPNGVDIIDTAGLLEFTINGVQITGPQTMIETGPNTGRFYVGLELPDTVNGKPLSQDDIVVIKYLDQSDAAGKNRVSTDSIPLSKAYAQMQKSGGQRIGHPFSVRIYEPDSNLDSDEVDRIPLSRIEFESKGGVRTTLANPVFDPNSPYLLETGENTGVFEVIIKIPRTIDGKTIHIGDWYEMTYVDITTPSGTSEDIVLRGTIGQGS
jgi:hypothetical protein